MIAMAASAILLVGCGGSRPTSQPEPSDPELVRQHRVARFAFENGQYSQSAVLYQDALERAYARDDLSAIGDIGYELALTFLRLAEPEKAATFASGVERELLRRGAAPPVEIKLLRAVALYAGGNADAAWRAAQDVVSEKRAVAPMTAARAHYILGSISADRGDAQSLTKTVEALGEPSDNALRADRLELSGRLRVLDVQDDAAVTAFLGCADIRRNARDYLGMARVLAFAGDANQRLGRPGEAADLYLRAGRTAQQTGWMDLARRWLEAASKLATAHGQPDIAGEATRRLAQLERRERS